MSASKRRNGESDIDEPTSVSTSYPTSTYPPQARLPMYSSGALRRIADTSPACDIDPHAMIPRAVSPFQATSAWTSPRSTVGETTAPAASR